MNCKDKIKYLEQYIQDLEAQHQKDIEQLQAIIQELEETLI